MRDDEREPDDVLGNAFDHRLAGRLWAAARAHHRLIFGSTLLFPMIAVVELAQPYLLKIAIDDHMLKSDWLGLTAIALLYLGALVVLYALRTAEAYLMHVTGQRVTHDLRARIFDHLLRLDARFYDRTPIGRLMTRVLNDVEAVSEAFTSGIFAIVADAITLAGVVVVMLWMDWRLALVTFSIVPVLAASAAFFRLRARDAYREVRRRLARLNGFLQESLQGMTVIQLFARERQERETFRQLNADYRRALFGSTMYEASLYASVEALGSIAVALLVWYGGRGILADALTFGALVAFIQYTNRFFLPIRDLGAKYTIMQSAMASSERIFGLLDVAPSIVTGLSRGPSSASAAPGITVTGAARPDQDVGGLTETRVASHVEGSRVAAPATIEFRSVWFGYEPGAWVLRDCTFAVAPGERVAIVGATGEGKSTCARLLNRSYDVERGRVLVGGVDVREWDLRSLRRHVGIVFQDSVLFTGTVEANLKLGADGVVSRAELQRAVDAANATALIATLPKGFDEELVERGANVSHGQRQLLAIARALVYNPAILVLDEATASVDPESEALVQQAMARLVAGRTSITIAHRLSTIQGADRILVLHRGQIHEAGSHAELLRRGGLYAKLYEFQLGASLP